MYRIFRIEVFALSVGRNPDPKLRETQQ